MGAISRYKIANAVKKYFNMRKVEIIPCAINSLGLLEKRPLQTDLDDSKFANQVGIKHFDIDYYLDVLVRKT